MAAHTGALTTITSTTLLDGLRDVSNRSVWARFVSRYRPTVVRFGCRAGLREDEAENAAQEALKAFAIAYGQGKYQRDRGRLRDWLYGIASNHLKRAFRLRPARERQIVDGFGDVDTFDAPEEKDVLEVLWEEEWRQSVICACLHEAQQVFECRTVEAFRQFVLDEQPARAVAESLGMTENAVYLAKHKVMKYLRQIQPAMEEVW